MQFISYAQNYEDVMLWRALKLIKEGFYIDIGAWSPDDHSVTRVFSENGWRGINIEPNPHYFTQLAARRPRDINLPLAVGERSAVVKMHMIPESGLSTGDANVASVHASNGWKVDVKEVELTPLSAIWSKYVPAGQEVHFLKIDVEGLEKAVISGNDWASNRPWIVVVEAISPLTHAEDHFNWEGALLSASYVFCYADGINRYYVANEHADLIAHFKYPPNVFDRFTTAQEATLTADAASLRSQIHRQEQQVSLLKHQVSVLEQQLSIRESEIDALKTSTSWKITQPIRSFATQGSSNMPLYATRAARAVWWSITPWRMPARMRTLRERDAAPGKASLVRRDGPVLTAPREQVENLQPASGRIASGTVPQTMSSKRRLVGRMRRAAHAVVDPVARRTLRSLAGALSVHLQQVMAEQNATALAEMRQLAHEIENVVLTLSLERRANFSAPKSPVGSGPDNVDRSN
jgi:FkbM family methyltransferase